MGSINSYRDLIVWQKSVLLVKLVYTDVKRMPAEEQFGLTSQIKRSAVSVPSNIAEGWGRELKSSHIQFLRVARGSLFELETQLLLAVELGFLSENKEILLTMDEVGKMLNGLIKSIEAKRKE